MYLCEQLILMERCESMNISKMWILVAAPLMLIIVIGGCWYMIIGKKRLKIVSQRQICIQLKSRRFIRERGL